MTDATDAKKADDAAAADAAAAKKDAAATKKEENAAAKEAAATAELDTTVDSAGITRVAVTTVQDGWEPAAVEPSKEAVEAAKKRNA